MLRGVVLRRLLEDVGLSPDAARALLSRMRRHGQLVGDRRGRDVEYRLAGTFAEGFERVRKQSMAQPIAWAGHFPALLYQVPELHRSFRDELRRRAVLSGYGILQQGVLISLTDRSDRLSPLLANPPTGAQVWQASLGMTPTEGARAASVAWALEDLAHRYNAHIQTLSARIEEQTSRTGRGPRQRSGSGDSGSALMRDFAEMLAPALTDTLREPALPIPLLPADWPGPRLRQTFNMFTATFAPAIERYVESMLDRETPHQPDRQR